MTDSTPYFLSEAVSDAEFLEVASFHTIVQKCSNYPMAKMSAAFDSTFSAMGPLLEEKGISVIGPAFALYHTMPEDTANFEVGIPVDAPLDAAVTTADGVLLEPSMLPEGSVARISCFGPYEELAEAWGGFMYAITSAGKQAELPFWELYVTEPSPEIDPATLRTDLVVKVTG